VVNSGLEASSGGNVTTWPSRINGPTFSQPFSHQHMQESTILGYQVNPQFCFPLGLVHVKPKLTYTLHNAYRWIQPKHQYSSSFIGFMVHEPDHSIIIRTYTEHQL